MRRLAVDSIILLFYFLAGDDRNVLPGTDASLITTAMRQLLVDTGPPPPRLASRPPAVCVCVGLCGRRATDARDPPRPPRGTHEEHGHP